MIEDERPEATETVEVERESWPAGAIAQIALLQGLLGAGALTEGEIVERIDGANTIAMKHHLEALVMVGEARVDAGGAYHLVGEPA